MKRLAWGVVVVCVLSCIGRAGAELSIDYSTTIDYDIDDDVTIVEGANPDPPTTVEFAAGSAIAGRLNVHDDSVESKNPTPRTSGTHPSSKKQPPVQEAGVHTICFHK